ncbi:hypothetical protein MMC15_005223 [Xylographa vitiligo]|nr:hypothetical protein [Xylographa vitiligo]
MQSTRLPFVHDAEEKEGHTIISSVDVENPGQGRNGITLIPRPSDDPQDPLNWPQSRKYTVLAILCLSAFSGLASSLANQLGFEAQAKLYDKSLVEISYSIASAVAGIAFGPLLLVPLAHVFGRSSVIWWTLVGCLCCNIWAATRTGHDDYNSFVISRLFGGIFGGVPSILGAGTIVEIFFLHERGVAFATFSLCFLLGTAVGPTLGGFIVESAPWPNEFWWTVGLQGVVIILGFFFLEETGFNRGTEKDIYPPKPDSFFANRIATFFPGTRVTPRKSVSEVARYALTPILIGLSPVGFLAGAYTLGFFGWFVTINTLLTVFLQEPLKAGGYAFTPLQNAAFSIAIWLGIFATQIYGTLLNDRIPLALARRYGGTWAPEYRLHALWVPSVLIMPAGLGIFGAALQYHLHYMVLALGTFLVTFGSMLSIPVATNYVVECFRAYPTEVATIMGVYRLALGLAVPFFIDAWIAAVDGPGWVFGMMAFFSLLAFSAVGLLMWKGHKLRGMRAWGIGEDEEGVVVIRK